ncbi:hypothetical protein BDY19DRAFT_991005 [Irpex rosettiformis]|uniref:Uncharacterized protein n=1 Tax=Irpex rosettiformis TaxID=378272 RepID=A0ACB8UDE0_9APHY|nr:hypothetical protein BDY19DRAFT_991005 [Irpex rosettiformis]
MAQPFVPTVNDLRVKMCYICREEERYDEHPQSPVVWVHPCNCTLVAHEKCLLNWIQSSLEEPSRKNKALKCPQCGATYVLESDNPALLKILNNLNASVTLAGKVVFACGIAGGVAACASGLYFVLTSYGAYAVQQFLGKEMYDVLLSDDISRWPWHAFINLPLIPVSLILSRTKYVKTLPLISMFYCWTTTTPIAIPGTIRWRLPVDDYPFQPILTWPPSPAMVTAMLPLVSRGYHALIQRIEHWAMGIPSTAPRRIGRIELALADAGPLNVRIAANFLEDGEDADADGAVIQAGANGGQNQQQDADAPARDPAAAAAETVRITGSSLGRYIGGALLIPRIASFMGEFLFQLSLRSPMLRSFLAIRQPLNTRRAPNFWSLMNFYQPKTADGSWRQVGLGVRIGLNVLLAGTKTWADADPVWWRNSVGLGIFIFARDCLRILHLSLAKREIETRRIKSRTFAGIDLKELDLINRPPTQ